MSLVVTVETERQERLKSLVDNDGHLARLALELESKGLIGSIDPFGLTMINRLQIDTFLRELDAQLSRPERSPGEHEFIRQVVGLARMCEQEGPHLYLWFRGD